MAEQRPHGFFRASSCRSFRGETGAEFGSGSKEEVEEEEDDDENNSDVKLGAEENWKIGSRLLPDRWDVLGLGQAMVMF